MLKQWIAKLLLYFIKDHLDAEVCHNSSTTTNIQLLALLPSAQPADALFELKELNNLIAVQGTQVSPQALRVVSLGHFNEKPNPVLILPKPELPTGEDSHPDFKIKGICFSENGDKIIYEIDEHGVLWLTNQFQLGAGTEIFIDFQPYLALHPVELVSAHNIELKQGGGK